MTTRDDLINLIEAVVSRVDVAKIRTLNEIIPKLRNMDELLAHNAETARDQLQHKADAILVSVPNELRDRLLDLLPRTDKDSLQIAIKLLDYNLPNKVIIFLHLEDMLDPGQDIPFVKPGIAHQIKDFLRNDKETHLVIMSHESSDVTTILTTVLCGQDVISEGRVSIIYESGLGLYFGTKEKKKLDYTKGQKVLVMQIIERMSVAAATLTQDPDFHNKFYLSASEYSIGIKVHPFARSSENDLDKEAASTLVHLLAISLSDMVKEDIAATEEYIYNYFLKAEPALKKIFTRSATDRVWDVEIVDEYLADLRFVHLGSRGSIIRPSDITDVPAAETISEHFGKDYGVICAADNKFSLPIMNWAISKKFGLIACSESADQEVKGLVESRGGIEYNAGDIVELLRIIDTYTVLRSFK